MATWAVTYDGSSRDRGRFEETITVERDTLDFFDAAYAVAAYHDAEGMRVPVFQVLRVVEVTP